MSWHSPIPVKEKFLDNFNMASGMLRSWRGDPQAWEASLRRFEAREHLQPSPAGAILFTGSSSITFWSTLAHDMAPMVVLNRGFGSSKIADVVHYAVRIVPPCHPNAVVRLPVPTTSPVPDRPRRSRFSKATWPLSKQSRRSCPGRPFIMSQSPHAPALETLANRPGSQPPHPGLHEDRPAPVLN